MKKKIVLEPNFPPPKITIQEEVYTAVKNHGPLTASGIAEKITRRSGGNVSSATKDLVRDGLINKRKCECKTHFIYEIVK